MVEIRCGIAAGNVQKAACRVYRVGGPRGPAGNRDIRVVQPTLRFGLRGVVGDQVGFPENFPAGRINRVHAPFDSLVIASGVADQYQAVPDDRSGGHRLAGLGVGNPHFPKFFAVARLVGDHPPILSAAKQMAVREGGPTIDLQGAGRCVLLVNAPSQCTCRGIQSERIFLSRSIQSAAGLDQAGLEAGFLCGVESA